MKITKALWVTMPVTRIAMSKRFSKEKALISAREFASTRMADY
jgi:hypothetical protein